MGNIGKYFGFVDFNNFRFNLLQDKGKRVREAKKGTGYIFTENKSDTEERGECMAVETATRVDTQGAAPDPVHLSCRPSKVGPKKSALPRMRPFGAGCKEEGLLKAARWNLAFHLLHGLAVSPRYRAETRPAGKQAALSTWGIGQSPRLNPAVSRPCLNLRMGYMGNDQRTEYVRSLESLLTEMRKFENGTLTGMKYLRVGLKPVEFFYGKVCLTDELAKQAGAEFIMLGDG